MRVSDLAKELNTTSDEILKTLKSLKLKAKDSTQDLSAAAVTVLKGEFSRRKLIVARAVKTEEVPADSTDKKDANVQKAVNKEVKDAPPEKKKTGVKKAVAVKAKAQGIEEEKIFSKTVAKEPAKPKTKISMGPVITLKPLARKKRKAFGPKEGEEEAPVASEAAMAAAPVFVSGQGARPITVEQPVTAAATAAIDESLADLEVRVPITVKDFSTKIQQKPSVVLKELLRMGLFAHINQSLDGELVQGIARQFGYNAVKTKTQEEQLIETHKQEEENPALLTPRAPVITFMGHVDHGKTSLLDRIRKTKVTDMEHGGITQHIGAYSVVLPKGRITFLDTPGHEAFTAMRARGAHITDIVVLVVAADEGVMPQTEEAIDHARAAGVPIVVALNKIDRSAADPDRVKKQLMERGLTPEDWDGKTIVAGVSAITGQGVDELLELILLEAELLELKANAQKKASGIVVDANLSPGKGAVTTLIVQSGMLKEGDFIVVGSLHGKVRAMMDDHGRSIKEAGPSMPVEILGLSVVPQAGDMFYVVDDERQAKEIASRRAEQVKNKRLQSVQKITLEDLYAQVQEGAVKELNVVIKADVQGSLEALKDSLGKIPSDKVKINFIHLGVGDVNASDVILAVASKAIIIAFHVGIGPRAKEELEKEPVDVRQYRIIYDAVNDLKKALEGLLEAKTKKKFLSRVEIREVFKLSKQGTVAGCYVTKGCLHRKDHADIIRNGEIVYTGTITTLKRFKDDVREVTEGMECGISFENFDKFLSGDIIEAYEIEKIAQKL
jgi:translation initiation factor IF-2